MSHFTFRENSELKTAVDLWISNRNAAENTYGDISHWDVYYVTDFSNLFKDKSTFNDDISSWM